MIIDVLWMGGAILGATASILNRNFLGACIWAGIGFYALSNYFERKLNKSKYDEDY